MDTARLCVCIFMGLLCLAAFTESKNNQGTNEPVKSVLRSIWGTITCAGGVLSGLTHSIVYLILIIAALIFLITNPWALVLLFFLG